MFINATNITTFNFIITFATKNFHYYEPPGYN